jgi:methyl-accepting chemotaxis protein
MAKSLINVIKAINALVADANTLSKATVDGKLDVRVDATASTATTARWWKA